MFLFALYLPMVVVVRAFDLFFAKHTHYIRMIADTLRLVPNGIAVEVACKNSSFAANDVVVQMNSLPHLAHVLVLFVGRVIRPYREQVEAFPPMFHGYRQDGLKRGLMHWHEF